MMDIKSLFLLLLTASHALAYLIGSRHGRTWMSDRLKGGS